jgi:hypothetical protein
MDTAFPSPPVRSDWKALYRAAFLETGKSLIKEKVSAAETAVLARRKELFACAGGDEKEALEEALYLLRSYREAGSHAGPEITAKAGKAAA